MNRLSSFRFWLILTGLLFIAVNIFFDHLFNSSLWIGTVFIWILLLVILLGLLIRTIVKKDVKRYAWLFTVFFSFALYNPIAGYLVEQYKGPIVLKAYLKDDLSGLSLTLRKSGMYELESIILIGPSIKSSGKYKMDDNKLILLDKPQNEKWINDTLYIYKDKIILNINADGSPDTSFANYFTIEK